MMHTPERHALRLNVDHIAHAFRLGIEFPMSQDAANEFGDDVHIDVEIN